MSNTYAINTTRGQEFRVADDLRALGLHPWVPCRLDSRYVKEKRSAVWYDRPYVPKLMFCVFPAVLWPDVVSTKHIIGKPFTLSDQDIAGQPAYDITGAEGEVIRHVPAKAGLKAFRASVEAEYADAQKRQRNSEYQCAFIPGQALEILDGPFEGFPAEFKKTIKQAHQDYAQLRVSVDIFGRETPVDVDPDQVRVR